MNHKIKMVVFDMAGTTVDENNLVYKILHNTLLDEGFECSLDLVLALGAGKEKRNAIVDVLKEIGEILTEDEIDNLFQLFLINLNKAYHFLDVKPQKGAEDLFKYLKESNKLVVLNTGYNAEIATLLLTKLNWEVGNQIDALITASDVTIGRPKPDMIFLAMNQFDITNADEVAKIGDSIIDIEEGFNAGCGLVVGITTGAHTYSQLVSAKPDIIVSSLLELKLLL